MADNDDQRSRRLRRTLLVPPPPGAWQRRDRRAARRRPDRRGRARLRWHRPRSQRLGAPAARRRSRRVDLQPGARRTGCCGRSSTRPHASWSPAATTAPGRATSTTSTRRANSGCSARRSRPATTTTLDGGGFVGLIAHDVTRARDETTRLRHQATHDALTGLANRRRIMSMLAAAIADQRQPSRPRRRDLHRRRPAQVRQRCARARDRRPTPAVDRPAPRRQHPTRGPRRQDRRRRVPRRVRRRPRRRRSPRARRSHAARAHRPPPDPPARPALLGEHRRGGERPRDPGACSTTSAAATMIGNADTAMYEAKAAGRKRCVLFTAGDALGGTGTNRARLPNSPGRSPTSS